MSEMIDGFGGGKVFDFKEKLVINTENKDSLLAILETPKYLSQLVIMKGGLKYQSEYKVPCLLHRLMQKAFFGFEWIDLTKEE